MNGDDFFSKYDEYDLVVSLGGCCSVATQLHHRGKRPFSLPFDWTLMVDEKPIEYLIEGLRNRFDGFMKFENMEEFESPVNEYGRQALHVMDKMSGFRFIHLFYGKEWDRRIYERGYETMQRRIRRMYEVVGKSRRVMFILHTMFPFPRKLAERLRTSLSDVFPEVEIELRVMQLGADCAGTIIEDGGLLRMYTISRRHNIVYDNQLTSSEWCFMDELRIRSMMSPEDRRKKSLWTKWKFKLWRHLGKTLEREGAGCVSMRFRKFGKYFA